MNNREDREEEKIIVLKTDGKQGRHLRARVIALKGEQKQEIKKRRKRK